MSFDLRFTKTFIKHYNSLVKTDDLMKKRVKRTLEFLVVDPYYPSLHTHKVVINKWGEVFSSRISGDIRVIWSFDKNNRLILIILEIGGHDDIY